jgi:hypothetical protein
VEVLTPVSSWLGLGNEQFEMFSGVLGERLHALGGCENDRSMELTEAASMAAAAAVLGARAKRKGTRVL